MQKRIESIREKMRQQNLDAYLLQTRENKYYVSGLDHVPADNHSVSLIFITEENTYFLIGKMEAPQVAKIASDCVVLPVDKGDTAGSIIEGIVDKIGGIKTVGYEYWALKHLYFDSIKKHFPNVEFVPAEITEELRQIKSEDEIIKIKKSMEIADAALDFIQSKLVPGISEIEVSLAIESFVRTEFGVTELAFQTIVASGVNSANPHNIATEKKIEEGDYVTIDFGVRYDGYCSDITRTFIIGKATEKQEEVYNTVLAALLKATAEARPGKTGKELDQIARDYIKECGYGEYFIHGLGHSLGIEVHEAPFISGTGDKPLEPNVVFTIEPGIYIPDWGGVRIENSVIMTEDGVEILTKTPISINDMIL